MERKEGGEEHLSFILINWEEKCLKIQRILVF
jgi:hypothetical protein